jgi:hypothetical protein
MGTNARDELIEALGERTILCARLTRCDEKWDFIPLAQLAVGYTDGDAIRFMQALDFTYDSGFGHQYIDGTVWLTDGSWLERKEYDGSEWWTRKSLPTIPDELKARED